MNIMEKRSEFEGLMDMAKEPEMAEHQHTWEAALLATLAAHTGNALSEVKHLILSRLAVDDFTRSDHQAIFRAVNALCDDDEGVDRTTVKDWLRTHEIQVADEDVANIFDARPTEDPKLVTTYLDRIATRGRFRRASTYVRDVLARLEQAEAEGDASGIDNAIAKVQRVAFDLDRLAQLTCELKDEAELLDAFLLYLEARRSDRGFTGLDTGFEHTNHVTNGLGQGLYILAGPPSCGKTTLAKQLADQVADNEGVPVLIYSYEQSGEDLRIKTLARLGRLNALDIVKGRFDNIVHSTHPDAPAVKVRTRVEEAKEKYTAFGRYINIIEADHETTIDKIRIQALAAKRTAEANQVLIVIDYLQIVPVLNRKEFASTRDRVDWLCSELRRLARDLDSPIIAVSSENRLGYDRNKKPTLSVFKESGGIEYSADLAAALWTEPRSEGESVSNEAPKSPSPMRSVHLCILKNRNGPLADIKMGFWPDIATFAETGREFTDYTDSIGTHG